MPTARPAGRESPRASFVPLMKANVRRLQATPDLVVAAVPCGVALATALAALWANRVDPRRGVAGGPAG